MQVTIARQLGLEPTTVGNFFMNARRRSMDKWKEDNDPTNTSNTNSKQQQSSSNPGSAGSGSNQTVSSTTSSNLTHIAQGQTVHVVTLHHASAAGLQQQLQSDDLHSPDGGL